MLTVWFQARRARGIQSSADSRRTWQLNSWLERSRIGQYSGNPAWNPSNGTFETHRTSGPENTLHGRVSLRPARETSIHGIGWRIAQASDGRYRDAVHHAVNVPAISGPIDATCVTRPFAAKQYVLRRFSALWSLTRAATTQGCLLGVFPCRARRSTRAERVARHRDRATLDISL